jgi:hypothetical protein
MPCSLVSYSFIAQLASSFMASTLPVHTSVAVTAVPSGAGDICDTCHPETSLDDEPTIDALKAKDNGLDDLAIVDTIELMSYRGDAAVSTSTSAVETGHGLLGRTASENLGLSCTVTDTGATAAESPVKQTRSQQRMVQIQFAAMCYALFVCGWHYGTTGVMLPRIQKVYNVNKTTSTSRDPALMYHPLPARFCCRVLSLYLVLHCRLTS